MWLTIPVEIDGGILFHSNSIVNLGSHQKAQIGSRLASVPRQKEGKESIFIHDRLYAEQLDRNAEWFFGSQVHEACLFGKIPPKFRTHKPNF